MLLLVISDFHLGKGKFFKNGQKNILEDFDEDERFVEFMDFYSSEKYRKEEIHLVFNGDIFNLLQIDTHGIFTHIIDEEVALYGLNQIIKGHPDFFESIRKFANTPNKKITYVIGNHDTGILFKKVQERLEEVIGIKIEFTFTMVMNGVHIEHGQRFEGINTVPNDKNFCEGPNGKQILNLPWGSLFCILVLPNLKKERPYLDKIRPLSSYIKWCLFHDFKFFLSMLRRVLAFFLQTRRGAFNFPNRNVRTTMRLLKDITIYPHYEKQAKRILKSNKDLHTVVMGHTHLVEWRKFPEGKFYFNTGTWNQTASSDAGLHQQHTKLSYVKIEFINNVMVNSNLNVWHGKWRPYREEVSLLHE